MGNLEEQTTLIRVTKMRWKQLNAMKEPGESFDDVIKKLVQKETE